MDECIPPLIRDSRWFMYPFYWYAYRGKNLRQVMDFKRLVHTFTEEDYKAFYAGLDTISRNRATDLNEPSIRFMIGRLDARARTLLDVGSGNGYFLHRLRHTALELHGCDIVDRDPGRTYAFTLASAERLPYADKQFDIVTCSHTIEHLLDLPKAITELKRVARRQLIIATPCQRYFYYTLDEHVHFFPHRHTLTSLIGMRNHECRKLRGDWVYVGYTE